MLIRKVLALFVVSMLLAFTFTFNAPANAAQSSQTIEAESGVLAGGATIMNSSNASGGQAAGNLHLSNASCQMGGIDGKQGGATALVVTYSSNDAGASKGLFVNGTRVQTLNFSNTGGWNTYTSLTVTITLNAGANNTIMIKNDQANNFGINLDKIAIVANPQSIEAESGVLAGGATIMNSSNASGGQATGNLHLNNASCQMGGIDGGTGGQATLVVTYSSNDTGAGKGLFVNGTRVQTLDFPNTGGWNAYTTLTATVTLNAGTGNTVMIKNDQANNYGINLDKIAIIPAGGPTPPPSGQSIEAESGALTGGASVMNSSNASGRQAVGNLHLSNASCQMGGIDGGTGGTATLVVTYSSNDAGASKGLFVNGTKVQTLSFSNTGGWNAYTSLTVTVVLNAGTGNTIMIKNDQADGYGINLDKIAVTSTGGSTPPPSGNGLEWAPPTLAANAVTYNVSGSGRFTVDPGGKDALVILPATTFTGQIYITHAHNVIMMGGEIHLRANVNGDDRAIYIADSDPNGGGGPNNGTIHIEGVHVIGGQGYEGDGIAIASPGATVQVENCRFDTLFGANSGHTHSDFIQPWGGVDRLRVDRFTGSCDYQGFFICEDFNSDGSVNHIHNTDIRNVNMVCTNNTIDSSGGYMIWLSKYDNGQLCSDNGYTVNLSEIYLVPRRAFNDSAWPPYNYGVTGVRPTVTTRNGYQYLSWPGISNLTGGVYNGSPVAGDYVPSNTNWFNYQSPGYK